MFDNFCNENARFLNNDQKANLENYKSLFLLIEEKLKQKNNIIIGIDGNCGAGKTTLANLLLQVFSCNVVSTDHFFLPFEMRTEKRLSEPGGNIDYERLLKEVAQPLRDTQKFCYRPYMCQTGTYGNVITSKPCAVNIIEGSYSLHPTITDVYDIKVFLKADYETQLQRIKLRNGEDQLQAFVRKWIPLENKYFDYYNIEKICDIIF